MRYWRLRTKVTETPWGRQFWTHFLNCISISFFFFFFNIDYSQKYIYVGKHVEGNMKNSFYICIKFLRVSQRTCEKFPYLTPTLWCSYGRPENVNLTHPINFITVTFPKCSFSAPPGSKNNWVYPIFHNI